MRHDSKAEKLRRAAARRFERNLTEMMDASDAEYGAAESFVGDGILRLLGAVVLMLVGGILASGWEPWVQGVAIVALAGAVLFLRRRWDAHVPPPPTPEPEPPFVQLIPRRRSKGVRRRR